MKIKPSISVITPDRVEHGIDLFISGILADDSQRQIETKNAIAYTPLINSHDHLIGN